MYSGARAWDSSWRPVGLPSVRANVGVEGVISPSFANCPPLGSGTSVGVRTKCGPRASSARRRA
jgi:hypothetical protein